MLGELVAGRLDSAPSPRPLSHIGQFCDPIFNAQQSNAGRQQNMGIGRWIRVRLHQEPNQGKASAWLLTDLLTQKKTRIITCRLWRFQPPKRNNFRMNLTTRSGRFRNCPGDPGDSRNGGSWRNPGGLDWHPPTGGRLCPTDPEPIGWGASVLVAPSAQHPGAFGLGQRGQFLGDSCLADTRFAGQHHKPSPLRQCVF